MTTPIPPGRWDHADYSPLLYDAMHQAGQRVEQSDEVLFHVVAGCEQVDALVSLIRRLSDAREERREARSAPAHNGHPVRVEQEPASVRAACDERFAAHQEAYRIRRAYREEMQANADLADGVRRLAQRAADQASAKTPEEPRADLLADTPPGEFPEWIKFGRDASDAGYDAPHFYCSRCRNPVTGLRSRFDAMRMPVRDAARMHIREIHERGERGE
ncbi:hypothetical protein CDO52_12730 [Nocardiopsis gilva YIM 90087]|uniref:Uncharacterized protein n=1 Tax=Nocardiopsis gilva YIM 90087 TaxID=1235441 RepID=A0A223S5Y4_9ACTN|nr:hypothetical protein [Nocardiopsis gilva]ASU83536.1 hypothetical protein CDO52_12730 [Nocardiopsis gilva YIM 90087]